MTIRTKLELLEIFSDNSTGDITAQDLRDFVESNLSYATVQASTTPFQIVPVVDTVITAAGSGVVRLPRAEDFGNRVLTILNYRPNLPVTITIAPGSQDTINGSLTNIALPAGENGRLVSNTDTDNWLIEFTPQEPGLLNNRDMPLTYAGAVGQLLVVNEAADGMEFTVRNPGLVYASVENNAGELVVAGLGVYEDVAASPVASHLLDFTLSGVVMTYIGVRPVRAIVTWDYSAEKGTGAGATAQGAFKIHHNGVGVGARAKMLLASESRVGSVGAVIDLVENDTIELRAAVLSGTIRPIAVTDMNVTVVAG